MLDEDPPRTHWSEILEASERLGGRVSLVPADPDDRVRTFGWTHELLGQGGLLGSWRLVGIHRGLTTDGREGVPPRVARYLAAKYGYAPERADAAAARSTGLLVRLAELVQALRRRPKDDGAVRATLAHMAPHTYDLSLRWEGNTGEGTASYAGYSRQYRVTAAGKPDLLGSADPHFRGDASLHNPEDLLVAALSGCHMLSYLAIAARAAVRVVAYTDEAHGVMVDGRFREVTLRPRVTVADANDAERARAFHEQANRECFIARSCNFPVHHEPVIEVARNTAG